MGLSELACVAFYICGNGLHTHTHTMVRVKRAAAIAGEAKRVGGDPGYGSDDDGFEAYLDHDDEVSTKYPCRLKSEGTGFYTAVSTPTCMVDH